MKSIHTGSKIRLSVPQSYLRDPKPWDSKAKDFLYLTMAVEIPFDHFSCQNDRRTEGSHFHRNPRDVARLSAVPAIADKQPASLGLESILKY